MDNYDSDHNVYDLIQNLSNKIDNLNNKIVLFYSGKHRLLHDC